MSVQPDDIRTEMRHIREDLTRLQGRVTNVNNMLNELALPTPTDHLCPHCGVRLRGPLSLAEHVHLSHAGPLPAHWAAAEQAAGLTDEEPIAHG